MPLFQSSDLARFFNEGENQVAFEKHFLVDRLSIATVADQQIYTIPDYILSIRRITYLGWKLDPLPQRNLREVFQSATQQGFPFWYVFNQIGQNQIKLFPAPDSNLPVVTNVWSTDIPNGFILEYFRATDNVNFTIIQSIRRQMLKLYAASRAYAIDGPGQNLKLVQYYQQRWEQAKAEFVEMIEDLYNLPRKLVISEIVSSNYFPGEPVLPIDQFGISVDEGY